MAYEESLKSISMKAAANLSAKQYCFVKVTADDTVNVSGDGECSMGVLQDKPVADDFGAVGISGVSKVKAGAILAVGSKVASDANGAAIVAVTTKHVQGIALTGAAAADEIISVLLFNGGILA